MSLGDVHIMMFYGCPENVNLTHSTKFITITLLKYSFSVPPGNLKNRVFPMSHLVTSLERPQDVNFKHNTNHITIVLFSILLTKFDG